MLMDVPLDSDSSLLANIGISVEKVQLLHPLDEVFVFLITEITWAKYLTFQFFH